MAEQDAGSKECSSLGETFISPLRVRTTLWKGGQKEYKSYRMGRALQNTILYAQLGYGSHGLIAAWHSGTGCTKVRPS